MVVVFHDAQSKAANEETMRQNYIDYGKRLEKMIVEIKTELLSGVKTP